MPPRRQPHATRSIGVANDGSGFDADSGELVDGTNDYTANGRTGQHSGELRDGESIDHVFSDVDGSDSEEPRIPSSAKGKARDVRDQGSASPTYSNSVMHSDSEYLDEDDEKTTRIQAQIDADRRFALQMTGRESITVGVRVRLLSPTT